LPSSNDAAVLEEIAAIDEAPIRRDEVQRRRGAGACEP
jgi:hypothetical protein